MSHLTEEEYETLNKAHEIIARHTSYRASWMFGIQHYEGCEPAFNVTYFDSARFQHSFVGGITFADKIQNALEFEDTLPTPEQAREMRIASLREELESLMGEPVP